MADEENDYASGFLTGLAERCRKLGDQVAAPQEVRFGALHYSVNGVWGSCRVDSLSPGVQAELAEAVREYVQSEALAMYEIGNRFLLPNLTLNQDEMETRRNKALDAITHQKGMVLKGEVILDRNQKVTAEDLEKLSSLSQYRIEAGLRSDPWQFVFPLLGRIFFAGAIVLGLALFLYFVN